MCRKFETSVLVCVIDGNLALLWMSLSARCGGVDANTKKKIRRIPWAVFRSKPVYNIMHIVIVFPINTALHDFRRGYMTFIYSNPVMVVFVSTLGESIETSYSCSDRERLQQHFVFVPLIRQK